MDEPGKDPNLTTEEFPERCEAPDRRRNKSPFKVTNKRLREREREIPTVGAWSHLAKQSGETLVRTSCTSEESFSTYSGIGSYNRKEGRVEDRCFS